MNHRLVANVPRTGDQGHARDARRDGKRKLLCIYVCILYTYYAVYRVSGIATRAGDRGRDKTKTDIARVHPPPPGRSSKTDFRGSQYFLHSNRRCSRDKNRRSKITCQHIVNVEIRLFYNTPST